MAFTLFFFEGDIEQTWKSEALLSTDPPGQGRALWPEEPRSILG